MFKKKLGWKFILLLIISNYTFATTSSPKECTATSPPYPVVLLELYTSEGCGSCTPADQVLNRLVTNPPSNLVGSFIPLAWHVDYWDYIGWKDRFANIKYTKRQQWQNNISLSNIVYTPQFMLNGRDFRNWSKPNNLVSAISTMSHANALIRLKIKITQQKDNTLDVSINSLENYNLSLANILDNVELHFVISENTLSSQVNSGENKGELLQHNAVVQAWHGPFPPLELRKNITLAKEWNLANLNFVAFLQNKDNGAIIQAVSQKWCF